MAAKKKLTVAQQEALQLENKVLREKMASQEKLNVDVIDALGGSIAIETKKIRKKGKSTANVIQVFERHDHKNISLWTKWGKRVGPMHPHNAVQALNRFADVLGIMLSVDKPSQEQIDAYNNSAEGKARIKQQQDIRKRKAKSMKSGQMEKLTEAIGKMAGVKLTNTIKNPKDV